MAPGIEKRKLLKQFDTRSPSCFSIVYQNFLKYKKPCIIFSDGSMLFEHQNNQISQYTFFDYFNDYYTDTFIEKNNVPYLICTCCGSFSHLDNVKYDPETIEFLNNSGLEIYLYETLFLDIGQKRKYMNEPANKENFDIDFEYNIVKNTITGFESSTQNLSTMYCFEFEKIQNFIENNNLTNVTIYSGDYNVDTYFNSIYPKLKFQTQDIFLTSLFKKSADSFNSYEYIPNNTQTSTKIEYKFWSGNRRYDGYRHLIVSYLVNKSALWSYQYKIEESPFYSYDKDINRASPLWGPLKNYLWFDLETWKDQYPETYNTLQNNNQVLESISSKSIDIDISNETSLEQLGVPVESYSKCFCAVITEAKFAQPTGNFSEKTLNAIKCFRPFILVAPPKTLEYLKQYGIKTFDDIWDESYDNEENHEKRLIKIFQVIDYIDTFSLDDLQKLYKMLLPRLQHNYKVIENISKVKFNEQTKRN